MNNKILKTVLYSGAPVLISAALIVLLYCIAPHSKSGFGDQPVYWPFIPLVNGPCTFNENGPYMYSYTAHVDTDNKCICFYFSIEGEDEIRDPGERFVMSINGEKHDVYRAPYEHFKETENEVKAYTGQVKDGSYVYTAGRQSDGISLCIICPMEGVFLDPADLNAMTIGFEGIYDVAGNQITQDEGHSDWIFEADRNGRMVPYDQCMLSYDTGEIGGISPGSTAKIYIYRTKDDMEFCDISEDSPMLDILQKEFCIDGLDADAAWSMGSDDTGEEIMVITLSNIGNNIPDEITIHFPAHLASGWKEGIHYTSAKASITCSTAKYEPEAEEE